MTLKCAQPHHRTEPADRTVRTFYEYDAVGNWVSKRTATTDRLEPTRDMIVLREIEYWSPKIK